MKSFYVVTEYRKRVINGREITFTCYLRGVNSFTDCLSNARRYYDINKALRIVSYLNRTVVGDTYYTVEIVNPIIRLAKSKFIV